MSRPPQASGDQSSSGDPGRAVSYLVSGVGLYGLVGWLLDRWLGTSFLLSVGIVLGAALGMHLTYTRFRSPDHE